MGTLWFGSAMLACAIALSLSACCLHPQCPNAPNSDARVPSAQHRVTVTTLDDAALEQAVCLVQSDDGLACEAAAAPPVCDKRPVAHVREALRPVFAALRGYRFSSPTAAVSELGTRLPAAGHPLVTVAVSDARRRKDCSSTKEGACVAVRWQELWFMLHADATGNVTSVDMFPNQRLCDADIR
jgi:hypothetical protein